jgi:hypothetical protein
LAVRPLHWRDALTQSTGLARPRHSGFNGREITATAGCSGLLRRPPHATLARDLAAEKLEEVGAARPISPLCLRGSRRGETRRDETRGDERRRDETRRDESFGPSSAARLADSLSHVSSLWPVLSPTLDLTCLGPASPPPPNPPHTATPSAPRNFNSELIHRTPLLPGALRARQCTIPLCAMAGLIISAAKRLYKPLRLFAKRRRLSRRYCLAIP